MKYLEQVRVIQFFLFEQQNVPLGEITGIFKFAFGPLTTPSPILANLYQTSGLPD